MSNGEMMADKVVVFSEVWCGYVIFALTAVTVVLLYLRRALGYREMAIAGLVCTCVDGLLLQAHPVMLTLDALSTLYPAWRLLRLRNPRKR